MKITANLILVHLCCVMFLSCVRLHFSPEDNDTFLQWVHVLYMIVSDGVSRKEDILQCLYRARRHTQSKVLQRHGFTSLCTTTLVLQSFKIGPLCICMCVCVHECVDSKPSTPFLVFSTTHLPTLKVLLWQRKPTQPVEIFSFHSCSLCIVCMADIPFSHILYCMCTHWFVTHPLPLSGLCLFCMHSLHTVLCGSFWNVRAQVSMSISQQAIQTV